MNEPKIDSFAACTLSLMEEKGLHVTLKYNDVSPAKFIQAALTLHQGGVSQSYFTSPIIHDNVSENSSKDEMPEYNEEEHMSTGLSKTELEALLRANKAEVDVVAATMKQEMTEWKGQQTTLFTNLNISLAKIDGKLDAVEGKIDGLKTSLTTTQWATSIGLTLVTIIMSAVMLTSSWIISGKNTSSSPQPTTQSQQVEPAKK